MRRFGCLIIPILHLSPDDTERANMFAFHVEGDLIELIKRITLMIVYVDKSEIFFHRGITFAFCIVRTALGIVNGTDFDGILDMERKICIGEVGSFLVFDLKSPDSMFFGVGAALSIIAIIVAASIFPKVVRKNDMKNGRSEGGDIVTIFPVFACGKLSENTAARMGVFVSVVSDCFSCDSHIPLELGYRRARISTRVSGIASTSSVRVSRNASTSLAAAGQDERKDNWQKIFCSYHRRLLIDHSHK